MTTWQLYLITRLDYMHTILAIILCISTCVVVIGVIGVINCLNEGDELDKNSKEYIRGLKIFKKSLFAFIISGLLLFFIPTQKDILKIYAADWATNSKEMQKLPDNTVKALNTLLENYIEKENKK